MVLNLFDDVSRIELVLSDRMETPIVQSSWKAFRARTSKNGLFREFKDVSLDRDDIARLAKWLLAIADPYAIFEDLSAPPGPYLLFTEPGFAVKLQSLTPEHVETVWYFHDVEFGTVSSSDTVFSYPSYSVSIKARQGQALEEAKRFARFAALVAEVTDDG